MQINLKVAKEDDKKNISLAKKLNPHKISKDFEQIKLTIYTTYHEVTDFYLLRTQWIPCCRSDGACYRTEHSVV